MLGYATEEIALRYVMCHRVSSWLIVFFFFSTGETIGGLLNATFG